LSSLSYASNGVRRVVVPPSVVLRRRLDLDRVPATVPTSCEEPTMAKGKRTFQPNNRRRAKVHGFRLRMRTRAGRGIVGARRRKGRASLTA
jgi:large subunit ribosomal protein L34